MGLLNSDAQFELKWTKLLQLTPRQDKYCQK
ncbi:hypothetical protein BDL97_11G050800 [Sphagnum fallax]|nr:hypothetical protein BDL97_11G050800 [Sphagnum fallax]